jgi:transposase
LSVYSPDLNPIEKMWSRALETLYQVNAEAVAAITTNDACGWIKSCGYNIQENTLKGT